MHYGGCLWRTHKWSSAAIACRTHRKKISKYESKCMITILLCRHSLKRLTISMTYSEWSTRSIRRTLGRESMSGLTRRHDPQEVLEKCYIVKRVVIGLTSLNLVSKANLGTSISLFTSMDVSWADGENCYSSSPEDVSRLRSGRSLGDYRWQDPAFALVITTRLIGMIYPYNSVPELISLRKSRTRSQQAQVWRLLPFSFVSWRLSSAETHALAMQAFIWKFDWSALTMVWETSLL